MTDTRKIQGEIALTDGTAPAFASVKAGARDMAQGVTQAATQAGQAVGAMGDSAASAAQKIDRSTGSMIAAIQRTTAAHKAGQKGTADFYEELARQRGINVDALRPYIEQLRAVERAQALASGGLDKMGVSARQTAAALRGVPAQVTDIVTALASGQAPITVLLQQGGQLKDMFGGVGAATRALGGYVLGLVNPYTVLAGAAIGVTLAWNAGQKEAEAYGRALILSGNAAGVTTGQLQGMAQRLATVAGTQSAAAEAIAQVAQSGAVGNRNLEGFTAAAIRYAKATGESVGDVVKSLEDLARSPSDAALKLNERYRFLTATVYEQVKALEDAGKKTEAADLAQKAFADTIESRAGGIVANLGLIERGWNSITGAIKRAWDGAKDVGRDTTAEERLAKLQGILASRQAEPFKFGTPSQVAAGNAQISAQIAALAGVIEGQRQTAKATADYRNEQNAAIAATERAAKTAERYADKQTQLNKALKEYRDDLARIRAENPNSPQLDPARVARTEAGIRAQYAEPIKPPKLDPEAVEQARRYKDVIGDLTKLQQDAAIKNDGLTRAMGRLHTEMTSPAFAKYNAAQQEEIVTLAFLADAEERVGIERKKAIKLADEYDAAMKREADGIAAVIIANQKAAYASAQRAEEELRQAELEFQFHGKRRDQLQEIIVLRLQEKRARLDPDDAEAKNLDREIAARQKLITVIKAGDLRSAVEQQAADAAKAWATASQTIEDQLLRAAEQGGKGVDQYLRNLFNSAVYRIALQPVLNPVTAAVTSAVNGGSLFGSAVATGNQVGSLASTSNLLGFGPGSSIYSQFATSGIGNALGLSTTVDAIGGLGTAANALTGAGQAFTAVMPYLTAILAVASLLDKGGETRAGGQYALGPDGRTTFLQGPSGGQINAEATRAVIDGTVDSLNTFFRNLGAQVAVTGFQAGLETSDKGRGGVFAGGTLSTGATFGESGKGSNYDGTLYETFSTQSPNAEAAARNFADDLKTTFIQGLQAAGDAVPKWVQRLVKNVNAELLDTAQLDALVAKLSTYPEQALASLGLSGADMAQAIEAGLRTGNATQAGALVADTFIQGIYAQARGGLSQQIQSVITTQVIAPIISAMQAGATLADALAEANLEEARTRVKALATGFAEVWNDPEVQRLLAGITGEIGGIVGGSAPVVGGTPPVQSSAPAVDAVTTALASASGSSVDAIAQQRLSLQQRLDAATLTRTELLAKERAATDAGNRDLFDRVVAAERAREVEAERADLLAQLNGLTDTHTQALARQREALDESNRALFDQVQATQLQRDALSQARTLLTGVLGDADAAVARSQAEFERAIGRDRAAAEAARGIAQDLVREVKGVFDFTQGAVADLRAQVEGTREADAARGNSFIAAALAAARATGQLPDADALRRATAAATRGIDGRPFGNRADADFQRLVLAGQLDELNGISKNQLSEAERQVQAAEATLTTLGIQLDTMRDVVAGLGPAGTVAQTLAAIYTALTARDAVRTQVGNTNLLGAGSAIYNLGTGTGLNAQGEFFQGADLRQAALDALSAGASPIAIYASIKASGFTLEQAGRILGATPGSLEEEARKLGLPVFHAGTPFVPKTGYALLQQGEAVVPRHLNNILRNAGAGDTARLEAQVAALTEETRALRAEMRALMQANASAAEQTARLLDKVTRGGSGMVNAPAITL